MDIKYYYKEDILNLIEKPEEFKKEIIESRGFILYLSKKYSIEIPQKTLIDSISIYSIRYLTEDIKERKYNKQDTEIIMSFLTEDKKDVEKRIEAQYSINDLISDIQNEKELPDNIDSLYELNVEDLNNHHSKIGLLIKESDDYWNRKKNIPNFIINFFKNIDKETFNKINKDFLIKNKDLLFYTTHLLDTKEQKQIYTDILEAHYNLDNNKKSGYKNNLDNYERYPFDESEKELFLRLLNNLYSKRYKEISRFSVFNKFFNKVDYIKEINIEDINELSEKQFSENMEELRKSAQKQLFLPHYKNFENIITLVKSDRAKEFFSEDFVRDLVLDANEYHHVYIDRDNKENVKKLFLFTSALLNLCGKDNQVLNIVGYTGCLKIISEMKTFYNQELSEEIDKTFKNIQKKFPNCLKSDRFFSNFNEDNFSERSFVFKEMQEEIVESMKNNHDRMSVNYLLALLKINDWNRSGIRYGRDQTAIVDEIKEVMFFHDKETLKELSHLTNFEFGILDKINYVLKNKKNNYNNDVFENNLLKYTKEDLIKMGSDSDMVDFLFEKSNKFRNDLLGFDLDEFYFDNSGRKLRYILNELKKPDLKEEDKKEYVSLLKVLANRNREKMLENFMSEIVSHPFGKQIMDINTDELDEKASRELDELNKEFRELIKKKKDFFINYNEESLSSKEFKQKKYEFGKIKEEINEKQSGIKNAILNMSFDAYKNHLNKIKPIDALNLQSIAFYNTHLDESANKVIINKIKNLNFTETLELVKDDMFLEFLEKINNYSYRNEHLNIQINNEFSKKENVQLVDELNIQLQKSKERENSLESGDKIIKFKTILSLFESNKVKEFANEVLIRYAHKDVLSSYDFIPRENNSYVRVFSNEQIKEIIQKLNENNEKLIFLENSALRSFLYNNYEIDSKNKENPENDKSFKDYVEMLKYLENDPLNYLGFINSNTVSNLIKPNKHEYRDITISEFYNDYINEDVIVQGIKEISKIAKETNVLKNSIEKLVNVLAYTYYSNDKNVQSLFDDEKSKKIIKALAEEAPYMLFALNQIGKVNIVDEILSKEELHEKVLFGLIFNSYKSTILPESLHMRYNDNNSWQSKLTYDLASGLLNNLINKKDFKNLELIDFAIKECDFNEERPWGKTAYEFNSTFLNFISNPEFTKVIEKATLFTKVASVIKNEDKKEKQFKI